MLTVDGGDGAISYRTVCLAVDKEIELPEGTVDFFNLDGIWYGFMDRGNYTTLDIVKDMNDFMVNSNPFGGNPFGTKMEVGETG